MQLRTAGWAVGRSGEGVKFTGCVSWRASPILGGSRHKSDRIFIDAKLAISSPVTIPELCISLGDSRSEVYPSRLFPPRSPTRSALFHAESFLPFPSPRPPPPPPPPLPLSLHLLLVSLLRNPLGTLHVSSLSPNCHPLSSSLPSVERRNITVDNCDSKNDRTDEKEDENNHRVETKSNRAQELQIQMQPQIQQTDTRGDRVYKKSSPNNKLTLYLASRDIIVSEAKNDNKLLGVLLVDPDYVRDKKVFGQVTLTFRYGREDEEVMGLKFCNEAMMCLAQLYPFYVGAHHLETKSLLQECAQERTQETADQSERREGDGPRTGVCLTRSSKNREPRQSWTPDVLQSDVDFTNGNANHAKTAKLREHQISQKPRAASRSREG
ncbi:Phosrestin-1 [Trachymyrmex zeteki]|uniref:Phosrestin-1 n=1 Tax=Mycetomoellerius zeteki TaxID=64791 RepID=A0A151XAJ7_9HYME|nr:Phosrestin-1 [Trachymyrmex zeteki]